MTDLHLVHLKEGVEAAVEVRHQVRTTATQVMTNIVVVINYFSETNRMTRIRMDHLASVGNRQTIIVKKRLIASTKT